MISSAARSGDAERCRELGIARYLTKPVVQADLAETILGVVGAGVVGEVFAGAPVESRVDVPVGRSILLVEDGLVNQRVAVGLLRRKGHDVAVANDGLEAIEALAKRTFDIVLMDVQMPTLDGFQAAQIIRQNERESGRHTPIVAMTASAMKGDRERCLDAGMDGYVSKPIDPQQLYQAIEEFAPRGPTGLGS